MPTETEEPRTEEPSHDLDHEHDHDHSHFEGGPVKTFLEHLEDLRWVLIKSLSAIGVAFTVCLLAGPQLMTVVKYPLSKAKIKHPKGREVITLSFASNHWTFPITPELRPFLPPGSNSAYAFQIVLIPSGTNLVFSVVPKPLLLDDSEPLNIPLDTISPTGGFIVATKVAIYGGLIIASPFVFYFIATVVFPALKMMERKYIYRGLFFGGGLFLLGVSFCYFFLMPVALSASVQFSEWLN